jgi:HSP20 family protein
MPLGRLFELRHGPVGELQREVNQLFDSLVMRPLGFGRRLLASVFPPVNIHEKADSLVVEIELPGVDEQSLDLSVTRDSLTLKGERPPMIRDEQTTMHIQERGYGSFSRAIMLPVAVDSDQVDAVYSLGVLTIRLPKAPEAMPRQVTVQATTGSDIVQSPSAPPATTPGGSATGGEGQAIGGGQ